MPLACIPSPLTRLAHHNSQLKKSSLDSQALLLQADLRRSSAHRAMVANGSAWGDAPERGGAPSPYTEEEAQVVQQAKRTHRETTASAQRALKVSAEARREGG